MSNRKLTMDELSRHNHQGVNFSAKIPVTVVLDNVRSLNNIGSVFRTCDALGVERMVLCGISGTPPHREIHRTALGAEESVPWLYSGCTLAAIKNLKEEGYRIYAIEQTLQSTDLRVFNACPSIKYALVFGNEVKGVDQEVINAANGAIAIPQFGTKHSFNISVTAGIVLWDIFVKLAAMQ